MIYLHIGNSQNIRTKDVIGIFDAEKEEQPSEIDRILSGEEAKKHVRFASMELPKSFVLYRDRRTGKIKICFSQLSSSSLVGRAREK